MVYSSKVSSDFPTPVKGSDLSSTAFKTIPPKVTASSKNKVNERNKSKFVRNSSRKDPAGLSKQSSPRK